MSARATPATASARREIDAPGSVFRVLEANLPELQARIERLARRARRLGTGPLALRDNGRREDGHALVVLEGEPPALAGWTLAAVIDHRGGAPVIRVVSSAAPTPAPRLLNGAGCEHCGVRRQRVETYVVWHAATRRTRQVGSSCLRDFLGGHDPERICRQAEYLLLARQALTDTDASPPSSDSEGVAVEPFAAHAAAVVRSDGWVSRARARADGRPASADAALRSLQETPDAPQPGDVALAQAALTWARTLLAAKDDWSAFERDAVAAADMGCLRTARERGLVCALIAVYRRQRARSRHLGRPGSRLDVVVLVERVVERSSRRHGSVRRHDLVDVDGNRLVWWQTRGEPLPRGEAIELRGRVADHTCFGRTAVTVLSHCRRTTEDRSR